MRLVVWMEDLTKWGQWPSSGEMFSVCIKNQRINEFQLSFCKVKEFTKL